jgi:hypothetical protein
LRSLSASDWEHVGKVNGGGNSNTKLIYTYFDINANSEVNYYTLNQCDFNGVCVNSSIIYVKCKESDEIKSVKIYDFSGREVSSIKQGMYIIIEYYDSKQVVKKIVKE